MWNDGINLTVPLRHADSAIVFANETLRVTTILVRISRTSQLKLDNASIN